MDYESALTLLGLEPGMSEAEIRVSYRTLMRRHHPDVAVGSTTTNADRPAIDAATITEAHAVVQAVLLTSGGTTLPAPSSGPPAPGATVKPESAVRIEREGTSILVEAPADETYQLLYDVASSVGGIGHVDRGLGLLEVIVRFEGGPSCSVLMSLQGRVHGTEVFLEMESIEAAETPSIEPVIEALLEHLIAVT